MLNLSLKVWLFICTTVDTQLGQPAKSGLFSNANGSLGLSTGQSGNQPTAQPGQAVSQPNAQQSQSSQPNPTSNSLGFGGQGGTSGKKAL